MPKDKILNPVTFYLYDYSNRLVKKAKKIYSPYNMITYGRTKLEDDYRHPDAVEFVNGQYIVDPERLGKLIYEQQIEWLSFYNPQGGTLAKGNEDQTSKNGRRFKNDGIHLVKKEKINEGPIVKTKTIKEKVEVQQIPKIIAETMDVKQLQGLAASWEVQLADNILDIGDAEAIKKSIIETLTQNGNIK